MRIIHVMTHLRLGAGRAIVDLCLEQRRGGHDVQIAVSTDAEGTWASDRSLIAELGDAGVKVTSIGDTFHRDTSRLTEAAAALRSIVNGWTDATIAHAHTAITGAVASWSGARRLVVTCHGWNLRRPGEYDLQDALALSLADAIVSPSSEWATRLMTLPGVDSVTVVPNGFDLSRYPTLARRAAHVTSAPRIICVGEVTRRKGQDLLVQAMPHLWATLPGTTLDIVGEGDMAADIEALAGEIDPDGSRIRCHGHVDQPYGLMGEADVFCLPSRSDNQPVAIIEAMLAGLPVVSTEVGGIPEMIQAARAGEVVPPESIEALAAALRRQLTLGDRETRSARAEAFARHEYGVGAMAERIASVYASTSAVELESKRARAVADPLPPT